MANDKEIILLTGTPGTGKTTLAKELDGSYKVIHLTEFIKDNNLGEKVQREIEVEINSLKKAINEYVANSDSQKILIEGHLAHYLDGDYCIVVRTRPDVLRERLNKREYSESKIEENLESEKIDLILSETVENQEKVYEINNTDEEIQLVVEKIKDAIKKREESIGNLDWSKFI